MVKYVKHFLDRIHPLCEELLPETFFSLNHNLLHLAAYCTKCINMNTNITKYLHHKHFYVFQLLYNALTLHYN